MADILRDFFTWSQFTPGMTTTGGTVNGSFANPAVSTGGILSLDPVLGNLTLTLPPVPTGTSIWQVNIIATLEMIAPNAIPEQSNAVMFSLNLQTAPSTASTFFTDADWGNFQAISGSSNTFSTNYHGSHGAGMLVFTVFTNNIATELTTVGMPNRKIHFVVDAVAV